MLRNLEYIVFPFIVTMRKANILFLNGLQVVTLRVFICPIQTLVLIDVVISLTRSNSVEVQ